MDVSLVAVPRQRNTDAEKATIKDGHLAGEIWPDSPAKASQKDMDWKVKYGKRKPGPDCKKRIDIATPVFGCMTHIRINRKHGIIRGQTVTNASADGARLCRGLIQHNYISDDIWADTAYRSAENEKWCEEKDSKPHPPQEAARTPMSVQISKANGGKSSVRAKVEHIFAHQKNRVGLAI